MKFFFGGASGKFQVNARGPAAPFNFARATGLESGVLDGTTGFRFYTDKKFSGARAFIF